MSNDELIVTCLFPSLLVSSLFIYYVTFLSVYLSIIYLPIYLPPNPHTSFIEFIDFR